MSFGGPGLRLLESSAFKIGQSVTILRGKKHAGDVGTIINITIRHDYLRNTPKPYRCYHVQFSDQSTNYYRESGLQDFTITDEDVENAKRQLMEAYLSLSALPSEQEDG